jgi:hypothetical protein
MTCKCLDLTALPPSAIIRRRCGLVVYNPFNFLHDNVAEGAHQFQSLTVLMNLARRGGTKDDLCHVNLNVALQRAD